MQIKYRRLATMTLAFFLAMASMSLSARYETEEPVDFTLPQLGGGEVTVSDYLGQWVVVNYWATWCAPCRKEIPELSELHQARADIVVLGLAFEDTDEEAFREFLADLDAKYPILRVDVYDPPQPFGAPKVLPTTIILDPTGKSVKAFLGPVTRESLETFINSQSETGDDEIFH